MNKNIIIPIDENRIKQIVMESVIKILEEDNGDLSIILNDLKKAVSSPGAEKYMTELVDSKGTIDGLCGDTYIFDISYEITDFPNFDYSPGDYWTPEDYELAKETKFDITSIIAYDEEGDDMGDILKLMSPEDIEYVKGYMSFNDYEIWEKRGPEERDWDAENKYKD